MYEYNFCGILNEIRYQKLHYKFKFFYNGDKILYLKMMIEHPTFKLFCVVKE
jgi:hypothetical protein